MKNLMNKTRKIDNPYATFKMGNFVSQILRAYSTKTPEDNPHVAWYTGAKSDHTYGSYEYGDTYIKEITDNLELVFASPEFIKQYPKIAFDFQVKNKLEKEGVNKDWMKDHLEIISY